MHWRFLLSLWALAGLGAVLAPPLPAAPESSSPANKEAKAEISFSKQVAPLLTKYCTTCHGGSKPKAGMALDKLLTDPKPLENRDLWDRVFQYVRGREMPPEGRPKPSQEERDVITGWIDAEFAKQDCLKNKDPGRVTLRRLNRAEYNNTIRDLVGVNFRPADDFPLDDVGYGFDNIGDVLAMPPILFDKYMNAAEKIAEAAFKDPACKKRILGGKMVGDSLRESQRQLAERVDHKPGDNAEKVREALAHFATRAYRRPATKDEVARLMRFVQTAERAGDGAERGLQLAVQAVLVSPHFLFKVEIDPDPKNPAPHPITEFELATRLSYFLWSTMPDQELFDIARQGQLRKNLDAQVRRMLKDPKAVALVDNFAGQWLQIRSVETATPDAGTFPTFDDALRRAMLKETDFFFLAIMQEDRSILDFLDADFTFVNERLAKHYGLSGVKGDEFRRVSLKGTGRGGILTHASILTVTSNPTRTSPVKRGKYILENILGTPPPPPPPDVPELSEQKELTGSLRQKMEQHRRDPNCATCHQRMDPLGFGFENFDGIGAWRTRDGEFTIDPAGELPDGRKFNGPAELRAILKSRDEEFRRCLIDRLLTYGLGRGLEAYDKCAVDDIAKKVAQNDNRFSSLVIEIVKSDPFQLRRGTPVGGKKK
jgi:mono/diheme cytochrome c family protein